MEIVIQELKLVKMMMTGIGNGKQLLFYWNNL